MMATISAITTTSSTHGTILRRRRYNNTSRSGKHIFADATAAFPSMIFPVISTTPTTVPSYVVYPYRSSKLIATTTTTTTSAYGYYSRQVHNHWNVQYYRYNNSHSIVTAAKNVNANSGTTAIRTTPNHQQMIQFTTTCSTPKYDNMDTATITTDVDQDAATSTATTTTTTDVTKSSRRNDDTNNIRTIIQNTNTLCREEIYPIGSIVTSYIVMNQIKLLFNVFAAAYSTNSSSNSSNSTIGSIGSIGMSHVSPTDGTEIRSSSSSTSTGIWNNATRNHHNNNYHNIIRTPPTTTMIHTNCINNNNDIVQSLHMFHESISAMVQLFARIVREPSLSSSSSSSSSSVNNHHTNDNPTTTSSTTTTSAAAAASILSSLPVEYYNCILSKWKDAAILQTQQQEQYSDNTRCSDHNYDNCYTTVVWSETVMAQFLIDHGISVIPMPPSLMSSKVVSTPTTTTSSTFQFIKYNTFTISLILQVALQQNSALLAVKIIESLWDKFRLNQYTGENDDTIVLCYNILMQSHINSGQKDTATKLETIWKDMQARNVQPNIASYHIRLKCYRDYHNLPEMESFLHANVATALAPMVSSANGNSSSRELSLSCWYEVLHCYMNAAMEKCNIERNSSLFYIQKGQTILQQTVIPQWLRYQKKNETDKTDMCISKGFQLIIKTYRNVLQRP